MWVRRSLGQKNLSSRLLALGRESKAYLLTVKEKQRRNIWLCLRRKNHAAHSAPELGDVKYRGRLASLSH